MPFPIPLVVTSIPKHDVLHANQPAQAWLDGRQGDPWSRGLESGMRSRLFQQLADRGAVDEFEVRWRGGQEHVVGGAVGAPPQLPRAGRGAHRLRADQSPEVDGAAAGVVGQGVRGVVREHHDHGRHASPAVRQPRVLPQHGLRLSTTWSASFPTFLRPTGEGADATRAVVARRPGARRVAGRGLGPPAGRRRCFPAWLALTAVLDSHGAISHYIGISIDITDRKQSEERIRYLAHHDVLTDLPNRSLCMERLRLSLQQAAAHRTEGGGAVHRPRPLQVHQRFARPPRGRCAAALGGAAPHGGRARRRHREPPGRRRVRHRAGGVDDERRGHAPRRAAASVPLMRDPHEVQGDILHVSCSIGVAMYPARRRTTSTS